MELFLNKSPLEASFAKIYPWYKGDICVVKLLLRHCATLIICIIAYYCRSTSCVSHSFMVNC